ncbi:ankyrin repeat protein [Colletotrichum camelliae]|nr:ankyrin repeat protein [Colletotrichum camelliae]
MRDRGPKPTCLSTQHHGAEVIRDFPAHYFGCIEISERPHFLGRSNPLWDEELKLQEETLRQQNGGKESKIEDFKEAAEKAITKKILSLAVSIDWESFQIGTWIQGVQPCEASSKKLEKNAFNEDKETGEYELEKDINSYVIQWDIVGREIERDDRSDSNHQSTSSNDSRPKSPLRQISTLKVLKSDFMEGNEAAENIHLLQDGQRGRRPNLAPSQPSNVSRSSFYKSSEDYLKPVEEDITVDYRFKGHFPDQRLSLEYLLEEKSCLPMTGDVILNKERSKDRVRYFHIPYNNMDRAIACYFRDNAPDHGSLCRDPPVRTRSHMILRPEYWRGQQHGGRGSVVHARHMRPICERVSSEIWDSEDIPSNLVLFMPYLHWEEDRKREKVARIIEDETVKCHAHRETNAKREKNVKVQERTLNGQPLHHTSKFLWHPDEDPKHAKRVKEAWEKNAFGGSSGRSLAQLARGLAPGGPIEDKHLYRQGRLRYVKATLESNKHGRITALNTLGQFLLDAARVYEAMAIYRDQQVLETYLHHDPPLHPRRTLDQTYYWMLKTTNGRDRDQVVYRATTMDERNMHSLREEVRVDCPGAENCIYKKTFLSKALRSPPSETQPKCNHKPTKLGIFTWDEHWKTTAVDGCDHCRGEIRKVSKIVMVDQLWMWILDKKTIITSFPERYGDNKQDPSGVHNSIRTRIKNARRNQIRSVFDVALIILDECLSTFFDRTEKFAMMNIFGEAIGYLKQLHMVSFRHLWHWTSRASEVYSSNSQHGGASHFRFPLTIPEGRLQAEINDVIEELEIMIGINNKQKDIIERFAKQVENIFDACGEWKDNMKSLSPEGADNQTASSPEKAPEGARGGDREREREKFIWFRKQAYDLISDVGDRIAELEELRKSAESTAQKIKDLLDFKQQQASIFQAWQSVKQADASVQQGRSTMIFTIVTIIFLPLSFMSSVFGMNNSTIGSDLMTFSDQANLMFPISAAVIIVSVVFAFWTFPLTGLWSACEMLVTWLLVKSGVYYCWLVIREKYKNLGSDALLKSLENEVVEMKWDVKWQRRKRKFRRSRDETEGEDEEDNTSHSAIDEQDTRQEQVSESGTAEVGSSSSWSRLYGRKKVPDADV